MGGGIYLIQDDDQLVEMSEQAYDTIERLQDLLEKNPVLLAGDTIDRETPRQWLLISREGTTAIEEDGDEQWSLNHIFLDRDAIPTLAAVTRYNEPHIRREAIGQVIEYAANIQAYWSLEGMLTQFEHNCQEAGRDPEQVFAAVLGDDAEEEIFWQTVKTNLQAGKIRVIFVSDDVTAELRRVVEFLNETIDPLEILALEIKQYVSDAGVRTLVPRMFGKTVEAQQRKSSTTPERRRWDETSFFEEYHLRHGSEEANLIRQIYQWARGKQPFVQVQWGTGDTYGGFDIWLHVTDQIGKELLSVGINGELRISSNNYATLPPFDTETVWNELRTRFSAIGLSLPADPSARRLPTLQISAIQSDELALGRVLETFDWVTEKALS